MDEPDAFMEEVKLGLPRFRGLLAFKPRRLLSV